MQGGEVLRHSRFADVFEHADAGDGVEAAAQVAIVLQPDLDSITYVNCNSRMFLPTDVFVFMAAMAIATLGSCAIVAYAFRRKAGERVLLWFGLFATPYGVILILRSTVFQLGFGQPETFARFRTPALLHLALSVGDHFLIIAGLVLTLLESHDRRQAEQ